MTAQNECAATPVPTTNTTHGLLGMLHAMFVEHAMALESALENEQREHDNTRWSLRATQSSLDEAHRVMHDRLVKINKLEKLVEDAWALIIHGHRPRGAEHTVLPSVWVENRDSWVEQFEDLTGRNLYKEDLPHLNPLKAPAKEEA